MDREDVPGDKAVKNEIMTLAEKRHQMTLEALNEADDGLFIEHREIVTWIKSLEAQCPLVLLQPKR